MARLFEDASSEYLLHAAGPISAPFAVAAWAKTDSDSTRQTVFSLGAATKHTVTLDFRGDVGSDPIRMASFDGTAVNEAFSNGYSVNVWQHLLGIKYADESVAVYLNGGAKGSDATTTNALTFTQMVIGGHYYTGRTESGRYLSGSAAEAAIWDLSAWDIPTFEVIVPPALASGYSPQFFPGLVAYWPLGGCKSSDNAANDASGDRDIVGGYHMSPVNTPGVADHPRIIYPSRVNVFPAAVAGGYTVPLQLILECAQ